MSDKTCCSGCKFWKGAEVPEGEPTQGQCRAHPPTVVVRGAAESAWPLTQAGNWCGEYEAAPVKEKEHHATHGKRH